MILTYATEEDKNKIALIEKVFNALTLEELQSLLSSDLVVAKLQGKTERSGVLSTMLADNMQHDTNLSLVKTDLSVAKEEIVKLKGDMILLIKILKETVFRDQYGTAYADFNLLKGKHGVY